MRQGHRKPQRAALVAALVFVQLLVATTDAAPPPPGVAGPQPAPMASAESTVLVYGGTPSGVLAAVAARRNGAGSVILLEPTSHIGGMLSSGLNVTDTGDRTTIGGITKEFFSRMAAIGGSAAGRYSFESHNAELVFRDMLTEAGVTVLYGRELSEMTDAVTRDGTRITAIRTTSGETFAAQIFTRRELRG